MEGESLAVKVALNIRPLIVQERIEGCRECITVLPGEPQVHLGQNHTFTFDHVYGSTGTNQRELFGDCVLPLVEGLFQGYNATVLAYGQTGSGKTYTMGSGYSGDNADAIIPKVMQTIFQKVEELQEKSEITIKVSYIEIHKEDIRDLLDSNLPALANGANGNGNGHKRDRDVVAAPQKPSITIRETLGGGITLANVIEAEVRSLNDMALYLEQGSLSRSTGSTVMNSNSSRSHAIFTITIEQKRKVPAASMTMLDGMTVNGGTSEKQEDAEGEPAATVDAATEVDDLGGDSLTAKLHLVDLAGSERIKRTNAVGQRMQEGIHINKGLLALGNVICALCDDKKRGAHVPYRDSKLTRLLQDSLGGNSRTVMIACVSPADVNLDETLNTLKYANRARNIRNKPMVNRNPSSAELVRLRSQNEMLMLQLQCLREASSGEDVQSLRIQNIGLEAELQQVKRELAEVKESLTTERKKVVEAQAERDRYKIKFGAVLSGKSAEEAEEVASSTLVDGYLKEIQVLTEKNEALMKQLQFASLMYPVSSATGSFVPASPGDMGLEGTAGEGVAMPGSPLLGTVDSDNISERENEVNAISKAMEEQYVLAECRMKREMEELDTNLQQKEEMMKKMADDRLVTVRQHYEKVVAEMEEERRNLQAERDALAKALETNASSTDDDHRKVVEHQQAKLRELEQNLLELKKKQAQSKQALRQKQRVEEESRKLQEEIQKIKYQKVQLQRKMKQEADQFQAWKASKEKELLQAKRMGRKNEFELNKVRLLSQRQQKVLHRKNEEHAAMIKRLKELLAIRKANPREHQANGGGPSSNGQSERQLREWIEREIELHLRVHEVTKARAEEMNRRKDLGMKLEALEAKKREYENGCGNADGQDGTPAKIYPGYSPKRVAAEIAVMKAEIARRSDNIREFQAQLLSVNEAGKGMVLDGASAKERWQHIKNMLEARYLLTHLFQCTTSARCEKADLEAELEAARYKSEEFRLSLQQSEAIRAQLERQINHNGLLATMPMLHRGRLSPLSPSKILGSPAETDRGLDEPSSVARDPDWFPTEVEASRAVEKGLSSPSACEIEHGYRPRRRFRNRNSFRPNRLKNFIEDQSPLPPSTLPSHNTMLSEGEPISSGLPVTVTTREGEHDYPAPETLDTTDEAGPSDPPKKCRCQGKCISMKHCSCRGAGMQCDQSCGCRSSKCSNRPGKAGGAVHDEDDFTIDPAARKEAVRQEMQSAWDILQSDCIGSEEKKAEETSSGKVYRRKGGRRRSRGHAGREDVDRAKEVLGHHLREMGRMVEVLDEFPTEVDAPVQAGDGGVVAEQARRPLTDIGNIAKDRPARSGGKRKKGPKIAVIDAELMERVQPSQAQDLAAAGQQSPATVRTPDGDTSGADTRRKGKVEDDCQPSTSGINRRRGGNFKGRERTNGGGEGEAIGASGSAGSGVRPAQRHPSVSPLRAHVGRTNALVSGSSIGHIADKTAEGTDVASPVEVQPAVSHGRNGGGHGGHGNAGRGAHSRGGGNGAGRRRDTPHDDTNKENHGV
ncbi:hypothetical protein CBR_g30218 [Chara braunii]|uniref:Kinesin motor domain-containing protein n=1 Tax=Chara braunii TaxID=69332 RepID=A0A388LCE1_CHABU|nr:hypothetical protein CBR_g30218 [Chara braunii]|eukprot:GBG79956.1 hypothetical protein CBR_g30218 [Chara braunii]